MGRASFLIPFQQLQSCCLNFKIHTGDSPEEAKIVVISSEWRENSEYINRGSSTDTDNSKEV